jgi:serine/threonine protein kinase
MTHKIPLKYKINYLGKGGQGLIMSKGQFVEFIKKIKQIIRENKCTFRKINKDGAFNDSTPLNPEAIPDDNVVKIICSHKWFDIELNELIQAKTALGLNYFEPENMGGIIENTEGNDIFCCPEDGSSINLKTFYVIFMKEMDKLDTLEDRRLFSETINPKNPDRKKNIVDTIIRPLMIQIATYHKLGYVHRDIKGDNIMMVNTAQGQAGVQGQAPQASKKQATLIDFGLAIKLEEYKKQTVPSIAGTWGYISCWFQLLYSMNIELYLNEQSLQNLENFKEPWPYKFMASSKNYENRNGIRIITDLNLLSAISETNMREYIGTKMNDIQEMTASQPIKDKINENVYTFLKMNDWYSLAVTILESYHVNIPALPKTFNLKPGFFSSCLNGQCRDKIKDQICSDMRFVVTKPEQHLVKKEEENWLNILESIVVTQRQIVRNRPGTKKGGQQLQPTHA